MEYHAVARIETDQDTLQARVTVDALAELCGEFSNVTGGRDSGEADSLWGHFSILRTCFRGGVRFQLLDCPNGLQWTVTTGYPPAPEHVFIHASINRTEVDEDFADSLQDFVDAMKDGLETAFTG